MITITHCGEQSAQTQGYSKHVRCCHLLYTTFSIVIASLRFLYFYRYQRSGLIPPFRGIEYKLSAWKIFNVTFSGIHYQIIRGGVERITRVYAGLCTLPKVNTDIERVPWMRKRPLDRVSLSDIGFRVSALLRGVHAQARHFGV